MTIFTKETFLQTTDNLKTYVENNLILNDNEDMFIPYPFESKIKREKEIWRDVFAEDYKKVDFYTTKKKDDANVDADKLSKAISDDDTDNTNVEEDEQPICEKGDPIFQDATILHPQRRHHASYCIELPTEKVSCSKIAASISHREYPRSRDRYAEYEEVLDLTGRKIVSMSEIIEYLKNAENPLIKKYLYYVERLGINNADAYKSVDIDRRLFSKLMTDDNYVPSKDTAIKLALSVFLNADEAKEFIGLAGYTFSPSFRRDLILKYCFEKGYYKLIDVNLLLDYFEEKILF